MKDQVSKLDKELAKAKVDIVKDYMEKLNNIKKKKMKIF